MKHIFRTLILTIIVSVACANSSYAQKKSETKFYNKVLAIGDTTNFNKFLAKYPNSVYAPKVQAKKDSLIKSYNTTVYTKEQAVGIIKENVPVLQNAVAGTDFIALPHKNNNVEFITAVIAPAKENPTLLYIVKLQENNGNWSIAAEKKESIYKQDDALSLFAFTPDNSINPGNADCKEISVKGERYMQFNYLNYSNSTDPRSKWANKDAELVANIVSLSDETVYSSMYKGELTDGTLNGVCMDNAQGGILATPQMNYLIASFSQNSSLGAVDKEREVTKEAIRWWYENNPKGRSSLEFGVLEQNHPIVQLFLKDKYKESSANNTAAFFDIMETTVLCVYNKSNKQYLLVWCEPYVKDKHSGKKLNTIYFEKGNTLVLYYYQGNKTFKERINLGTRQKR